MDSIIYRFHHRFTMLRYDELFTPGLQNSTFSEEGMQPHWFPFLLIAILSYSPPALSQMVKGPETAETAVSDSETSGQGPSCMSTCLKEGEDPDVCRESCVQVASQDGVSGPLVASR